MINDFAEVAWRAAADRGYQSGGIAFFLVDPLDLAIFIGGAVLAVMLALVMLVRPSPSWVTWSNLLGAVESVLRHCSSTQDHPSARPRVR